MEMRLRDPQYLRLHPQVRKDSRLEPKAWSQFSTYRCLGYLYAPGCLLSVLPPWGASGFLAQQLGLKRQEMKLGPRNGQARWQAGPCGCTCRSQLGGNRLPGGPSPPPHCERSKSVTTQLLESLSRQRTLLTASQGYPRTEGPHHLISLTRGIGCITTIFFLARVMMWGVRMNWPKHYKVSRDSIRDSGQRWPQRTQPGRRTLTHSPAILGPGT